LHEQMQGKRGICGGAPKRKGYRGHRGNWDAPKAFGGRIVLKEGSRREGGKRGKRKKKNAGGGCGCQRRKGGRRIKLRGQKIGVQGADICGHREKKLGGGSSMDVGGGGGTVWEGLSFEARGGGHERDPRTPDQNEDGRSRVQKEAGKFRLR